MMRPRCLAAALPVMIPLLGGCATIEAAPQRVIGNKQSAALVARYPMDEAIERFNQPDGYLYDWTFRQGLSRQQYRDLVVAVYMGAMESRYQEFRTGLLSEQRQANFGLDLTVLGFTGWASVASQSIVNNLSAVAAGFAGARGLVNKDLYFDQAVPALVAAMDADRFRAKAQITANLKRSAGDYPLTAAFIDLMGYEVSSTLDGAVAKITSEATQDREAARQQLATAQTACIPEEGADAVASPLVASIKKYDPDKATSDAEKYKDLMVLIRIYNAMGLTSPWTNPDELLQGIIQPIMSGKAGRCTKADLQDLTTKVNVAIQESSNGSSAH